MKMDASGGQKRLHSFWVGTRNLKVEELVDDDPTWGEKDKLQRCLIVPVPTKVDANGAIDGPRLISSEVAVLRRRQSIYIQIHRSHFI